jgi:hypothetical protein
MGDHVSDDGCTLEDGPEGFGWVYFAYSMVEGFGLAAADEVPSAL